MRVETFQDFLEFDRVCEDQEKDHEVELESHLGATAFLVQHLGNNY